MQPVNALNIVRPPCRGPSPPPGTARGLDAGRGRPGICEGSNLRLNGPGRKARPSTRWPRSVQGTGSGAADARRDPAGREAGDVDPALEVLEHAREQILPLHELARRREGTRLDDSV